MSEPPYVTDMSLETTDFEELQDSAEGWDQQYNQLSPGRFRGLLDMRMVGSRQIFREYWGRKLCYRGTAPNGGFGFALPLDQPSISKWVGQTVTDDTVIVQAPGLEANFVTSEYWDSLVLSISQEEIRAISTALSNDNGIDKYHHGVVKLRPGAANRLRKEGRRFLRLSRNAAPEDHARIAQWSEQVLKLFVWEVIQAQEGEMAFTKPSRPAQLVSKATDFVISNPKAFVGLTEICHELDVSLRTLHYAFNTVTGMSPAAWLRLLRLNSVHRTLKNRGPEDTYVKQVAMSYGFLHLGNFSRLYRRQFGCLPSEILRTKR